MLSGASAPVQHNLILTPMFQTLRKGATIYILDKTSTPEVKIGYVENVTLPRPMYPTYNPAVSLGTNMQRVVDITVRVGEEKKEFSVPSDLSIHTYGDYTISENKEAMISEVDSLMQNSKEVIESVDKHKAAISAYEDILKQLNPVYAKEQERDSTIDKLTQQVNGMQTTLDRLETILLRNNINGSN